MTQTSRCPHCGAPAFVPAPRGANGAPAADGEDAGEHPLDSLYREVRRIREIAEARETAAPPAGRVPAGGDQATGAFADGTMADGAMADGALSDAALSDSERRVAELTREVFELRATVARLRGSSAVGLVPSA